jgi:hypothetical protein
VRVVELNATETPARLLTAILSRITTENRIEELL